MQIIIIILFQLQVDPHVLQLAGHAAGSRALPVRAQASLPGSIP